MRTERTSPATRTGCRSCSSSSGVPPCCVAPRRRAARGPARRPASSTSRRIFASARDASGPVPRLAPPWMRRWHAVHRSPFDRLLGAGALVARRSLARRVRRRRASTTPTPTHDAGPKVLAVKTLGAEGRHGRRRERGSDDVQIDTRHGQGGARRRRRRTSTTRCSRRCKTGELGAGYARAVRRGREAPRRPASDRAALTDVEVGKVDEPHTEGDAGRRLGARRHARRVRCTSRRDFDRRRQGARPTRGPVHDHAPRRVDVRAGRARRGSSPRTACSTVRKLPSGTTTTTATGANREVDGARHRERGAVAIEARRCSCSARRDHRVRARVRRHVRRRGWRACTSRSRRARRTSASTKLAPIGARRSRRRRADRAVLHPARRQRLAPGRRRRARRRAARARREPRASTRRRCSTSRATRAGTATRSTSGTRRARARRPNDVGGLVGVHDLVRRRRRLRRLHRPGRRRRRRRRERPDRRCTTRTRARTSARACST